MEAVCLGAYASIFSLLYSFWLLFRDAGNLDRVLSHSIRTPSPYTTEVFGPLRNSWISQCHGLKLASYMHQYK